MLYNSSMIFVLDIICYLFLYIVVIPIAIFFVLNILVSICKIRNKNNDGRILVITIIISIMLSIILSSYVNIIFRYNTTSINNKKYSDLRLIINQVMDLSQKKTETIYVETKNVSMYTITKKENNYYITATGRRKRHATDHTTIYFYINIKTGEYIIPIRNMVDYNKIYNILYCKEDGNQDINKVNKIEVYRNTKFIKSINGIDI